MSDTRARVNLIMSYTDRTYSPLEMLRMASSYLPQGVTLIGFNYRREDGVKIADRTTEIASPVRVVSVTLPDVAIGPGEYSMRLRVKPKDGGLPFMDTVRFTVSDIPVIVCTSKGQETDKIWGLRQGAQDYLVKPVNAEELLAKIAAL